MEGPVVLQGGIGAEARTMMAAVAADANSAVVDFGRVRHIWGLQVVLTGTPNAGTVVLKLSNDGTNWSAAIATFTIGTDTNGDFKFAVDKPAQYARLTLASLGGGTAPTVTAIVSAV